MHRIGVNQPAQVPLGPSAAANRARTPPQFHGALQPQGGSACYRPGIATPPRAGHSSCGGGGGAPQQTMLGGSLTLGVGGAVADGMMRGTTPPPSTHPAASRLFTSDAASSSAQQGSRTFAPQPRAGGGSAEMVGAEAHGPAHTFEPLAQRADREGPQAWAQMLPRLNQHVTEIPHDAQAWAYMARGHAAQGNEAEAVRAAQEALRLDPMAALGFNVSMLLARTSLDAGNAESAVRHGEVALGKATPGDIADASELLARAHAAHSQPERAEAAWSTLARADSDRAARLAKAIAACSTINSERYRWLSKAVTLGKSQERPYKELGEACLGMQRDQEAVLWLQKAFTLPGAAADADLARTLAQLHLRAGRKDEAMDTYRIALSASHNNFHLHQCYGQLLLQEGRASDAADVIRRAIKLAPPGEAASVHVLLADLQWSMGQAREAIHYYETAIQADDAHVAAWRGLESVACAVGSHKEQRRALERLKRLEPNNADWHAKLGALLVSTDSSPQGMEEAERSIEEALKLSPKHPQALFALGKLATNEQQKLDFFEAAAASDPSCTEAVEAAASLLWARGSREQAVPWYRTLSTRRKNEAVALSRVAWGALRHEDASDARSLLQKAVQHEPSSQEALALLGYANLLLGQHKEGVANLQAAMRCKEGTLAATRLYWALLLFECGDERQAEEEFTKAAAAHVGLQHARASSSAKDAVAAGRVEPQSLAQDLPGAKGKVLHALSVLLRRNCGTQGASGPQQQHSPACGSPGGPGLGTPTGCSCTWAAKAPNTVTRSPSQPAPPPSSVSLASDGSPQGPLEEDGQDLAPGRKVEVYSKSAARWIPGQVVLVKPDVVKIKYLIDDAWCEKALLRSSDSWRIPHEDEVAAPSHQPTSGRTTPTPRPEVARQAGEVIRQRSVPGAALESPAPGKRGVSPRDGRAAHDVSPRDAAKQQPSRDASPRSSKRDVSPRSTPQAAPQAGAAPGRGRGLVAIDEHQPITRGSTPPPSSSRPARASVDLLNAEDLSFGSVIGTGGFGSVYRGTYCSKEVAIKKLHPTDGQITPAQLEEFKKEVANLMALQHPRLISFIGAAFAPPNLCIVTEFMPNGSLYDLLHQRRQPLSTSQRHLIASQIADGVYFLHGRQPPFVHRDLKSLNVVLDFALGVKLCDFGLTQTMESTHISRRGNEGGSPRYMAPELFDSNGKITEKVDIWALGCLIIETFTGRMPHEECNNVHQVMSKMLVERQLPFTDWRDVDQDMELLARACFEYLPKRRVDAGTIVEALSRRGK